MVAMPFHWLPRYEGVVGKSKSSWEPGSAAFSIRVGVSFSKACRMNAATCECWRSDKNYPSDRRPRWSRLFVITNLMLIYGPYGLQSMPAILKASSTFSTKYLMPPQMSTIPLSRKLSMTRECRSRQNMTWVPLSCLTLLVCQLLYQEYINTN